MRSEAAVTTDVYAFSYHILSSLTHEQQVRLAIFYAHEVLPVWEKKYPTDLRPRQAIEAAWQWVLSPTGENGKAAYAAADVASNAAAYAAIDAAYTVANAAAWSASAATSSNDVWSVFAIANAARALSSQKFPKYALGQLLSFRAVTTPLQDTESVGPVFLLQDKDILVCTLLDQNGKICKVEKNILHILRPLK